jgi:hypothetical protein
MRFDRDLLRSQGLGLACGFATVALLAIGSVVLAATRDGASAGVHMDDLRAFFSPPRAAHAWFYLLLPVAGLYALNTVLATWDTVTRKWRIGIRAPTAYAASVIHLGFLLALLAHAVGGLLGRDGDGVLVAGEWRRVPGFGQARLLSLEVDALPDGMPKEVRARLELRDPAGRTSERIVGYNAPLSAGGGARLALLADLGQVRVARLDSGSGTCVLAEGQSCELGGEPLALLGFAPGRGGAAVPFLRARGPSGAVEVRAVPQGGELALPGGAAVRLSGVAREPAVVLRTRDAPGNPWALASALLVSIGVALLWRKLVR